MGHIKLSIHTLHQLMKALHSTLSLHFTIHKLPLCRLCHIMSLIIAIFPPHVSTASLFPTKNNYSMERSLILFIQITLKFVLKCELKMSKDAHIHTHTHTHRQTDRQTRGNHSSTAVYCWLMSLKHCWHNANHSLTHWPSSAVGTQSYHMSAEGHVIHHRPTVISMSRYQSIKVHTLQYTQRVNYNSSLTHTSDTTQYIIAIHATYTSPNTYHSSL